jgi:hypothetical protein
MEAKTSNGSCAGPLIPSSAPHPLLRNKLCWIANLRWPDEQESETTAAPPGEATLIAISKELLRRAALKWLSENPDWKRGLSPDQIRLNQQRLKQELKGELPRNKETGKGEEPI